MNPKECTSPEEYKDFVEKCIFLVDKELRKLEQYKGENDHHNVALCLPKNISSVNFIGYLRGQDGMFLDFRPHTDFQKELYKIEDEFEKRLWSVIDYVTSSESKDLAHSMIEEYYLKHRGFNNK